METDRNQSAIFAAACVGFRRRPKPRLGGIFRFDRLACSDPLRISRGHSMDNGGARSARIVGPVVSTRIEHPAMGAIVQRTQSRGALRARRSGPGAGLRVAQPAVFVGSGSTAGNHSTRLLTLFQWNSLAPGFVAPESSTWMRHAGTPVFNSTHWG